MFFDHMLGLFKRWFGRLRSTQSEKEIQEHIYKTYIYLRVGMCILAFLLPFLLWDIGRRNGVHLQDSMSAYYFAFAPESSNLRVFPMRVVLVGILFAIGCFLILYKGFSWIEDWLLNVAGAAAIITTLYPMQAPPYCKDALGPNCGTPIPYVHEAAGIVIFVCLALVAWLCTKESVGKLPVGPRDKFRRWYRGLAIAMFLSPFVAIGAAALVRGYGIPGKTIFFIEWFMLWTFAFYWLLRSFELERSQFEWEKLTRQKK